jgi:hypothetical protein
VPLALAGAVAALVVSFLVLGVAWRTPRFAADRQGRPLPGAVVRAVDDGWLSRLLRGAGLAVTAYVAWAALAGPDILANPTFGVVYVLLWLGIVPGSLLLGPAYRAVNPLRTLHRLLCLTLGNDPGSGVVPLPRWVGLWPAAFGLLAFTWLELVHPEGNYLAPVRLWFAGYAVVVLVGAAVFGDRWIAAADPFEAYSTLVGHLSVFGRTADGTLVARSPLRNLDGVPVVPGLTAVVSVLVGSTAWDSFQESVAWVRLSSGAPVDPVLLGTAGLVSFCVLVGGLFTAATLASGGAVPRPILPGQFAHSLVPIVVGYLVAHYLSYVVEVGQQTLIFLSDPMVDGSNLLGTADLSVSYWLTEHPTLLAVAKVTAIVAGHVLGVIAAHDRAVRLLPPRRRVTGQLPLLAVMVGFTVGGISLLLTV